MMKKDRRKNNRQSKRRNRIRRLFSLLGLASTDKCIHLSLVRGVPLIPERSKKPLGFLKRLPLPCFQQGNKTRKTKGEKNGN